MAYAAELQARPPPPNKNEEAAVPAPFLRVPDPPERHGVARLLPTPALSAQVLRMAMPVVLGMLTQTAVNMLDTVMVGYLPKEQANPGQAAIGLALPMMWLVGGFLSAVWVGTQAITSRRAGEGNDDLAGRALTNSIVIAMASSAAVTGLALWAAPRVIRALYADPEVVRHGINYLTWRLWGIPAMVCTFSYKSFFDGVGNTRVFMAAAMVMNVLNVVLNWLLIFGNENLGIAPQGVAGAALASVIAAYVGLLILVAWSFLPRYLRRYRHYRLANLNANVMGEIIRLSVPSGVAAVVVMVGFNGFYWVVGKVNDLHAAAGNPILATANQVIVTVVMPVFMSAVAFGTATAAMVGQALGAKRPRLADAYGWEAAKLWAYAMGVYGLFALLFPDAILSLANPDPEVIALARGPLRAFSVLQGVIAAAIIIAQTMHGIGNAKFVMYVELVLHLLVMCPAAYLFGVALDLGLYGVYAGPALYALILGGIMAWKFGQGDWKHIKI